MSPIGAAATRPGWAASGKGIIGAINYLSGLGVNSDVLPDDERYGDGKKAWPWTGADNYYNYDCSKLDQWDVVFSHMDAMGMMLHVVLTETENESYFEIKELGSAGGFAPSRKIYYRELIARFGYHLAITWNLGEENGMSDASAYGAREHHPAAKRRGRLPPAGGVLQGQHHRAQRRFGQRLDLRPVARLSELDRPGDPVGPELERAWQGSLLAECVACERPPVGREPR